MCYQVFNILQLFWRNAFNENRPTSQMVNEMGRPFVLTYVTVHAKTYRKSAKNIFEIRADFASPIYILDFLQKFVWIARSVAEIRLFLYQFDGHIAFMKRQFLRARFVERNVSAHTSVY